MSFLKDQRGMIPLPLLLTGMAVLLFVMIATVGDFKDSLMSQLYVKPASHAATPEGTVTLALNPSQVSVAPNGTFNLDVVLTPNGESVSAAQIQVQYDPQILVATGIAAAGTGLPTVLTPGAVANGSASITVGATPTAPMMAAGTVATVTFKALLPNSMPTPVMLDQANTMVAVIGKTGDMAGVLQPTSVSVLAPSPSPVITPTPIPPSPVVTPTPIPSPSVTPSVVPAAAVIEGENMGLILNSGAIQQFNDSLASGGKGLIFYSNATSTTTFTTTSNSSRILVRARGDLCKGSPAMAIMVDNVRIAKKNTSVSSTSWTDYIYNKTLTAGAHTLSITYTNDYSILRNNCDRNLRIDKVTFR